MGLFITLAIYTVLVLVFVPLEKIAKAQTWVKNKVTQAKKKAHDITEDL